MATTLKVRRDYRHDLADEHTNLSRFKVPRKAKHEPVLDPVASPLQCHFPHMTATCRTRWALLVSRSGRVQAEIIRLELDLDNASVAKNHASFPLLRADVEGEN